MALIHGYHPQITLYLFLIGFEYFGMYFLGDVSPIHTFPSTVLVPKQTPWETGDIISLCRSHNEI